MCLGFEYGANAETLVKSLLRPLSPQQLAGSLIKPEISDLSQD